MSIHHNLSSNESLANKHVQNKNKINSKIMKHSLQFKRTKE